MSTKTLLLRIARIKPFGAAVGLLFQYLPFALPFKVVAQTSGAICFRHPVPIRPYHLLVIPKRRIQTLFDLIVVSHRDIVRDILLASEQAVGTKVGRYRIGANYGRRQEVMQVHFHLTEAGTASATAANVVAGEPISYSWQEKDGQLTRLTAVLNAPPGTSNVSALVGRDEMVDMLIQVCRSHAQVLKTAGGLSLFIELERAADHVAWSRSVYFTIEGIDSSHMRSAGH